MNHATIYARRQRGKTYIFKSGKLWCALLAHPTDHWQDYVLFRYRWVEACREARFVRTLWEEQCSEGVSR